MRAQGQRVANGPVWADWFLELLELLERREATQTRFQRPSSRRTARSGTSRSRNY